MRADLLMPGQTYIDRRTWTHVRVSLVWADTRIAETDHGDIPAVHLVRTPPKRPGSRLTSQPRETACECGAQSHQPCRTASGAVTGYHKRRVQYGRHGLDVPGAAR